MNLELISYSATQPNTGAAAAAVGADSLTVKNSKSAAKIVAAWATNQVAGFHQVAFPSGHDTTRGFRAGQPLGGPNLYLPLGMSLDPKPQELLSIQIAGSNVAGDVGQGSLLVYYDDLPGINMRGVSLAELRKRMKCLTTIETSVASTAGPSYGTAQLITAGSDLLKANTDYAVLGMSCRTAVHNLYLIGPDLGNVRIGVPGVLRPELTQRFFLAIANAFDIPIPVINSGNKASTSVGVSTDENAGTFLHTLHLAEI